MTLKRTKFYRLISVLLCMIIAFFGFGCAKTPGGDSSSSSGDKKTNNDPFVTAVEITSKPEKTEYFAGEKFSPRGLKFNATWNIDGEVEIIDMTYSDCESYTHKGEGLTKDVSKITFTIGGFNFDVPITVTAFDFTGLKVTGDGVNADCFVGTVFDLSKIKVYAGKENGGSEELAIENCTITENGEQIKDLTEYRVTKGKHEIKVTFANQSVMFTIRGFEKSDIEILKVKSVSADTSALKESYGAGEKIDLSLVKVCAIFTDEKGEVNLKSKVETGYTFTDDGNEVETPNAHYLTAGEHNFAVTYKGASASFKVTVKTYDTLRIAKRNGGTEMKIGVNADFDTNFAVYAGVTGADSEKSVKYGEYTLSETENGESVSSADIFKTAGQRTIWVRYGELKKSFVITVASDKYTLTLSGATYNGQTSIQLAYGESLPSDFIKADGWYNVDNPTGFYLVASALSGVKSNAKTFTMPANDLTIAPINFVSVRSDPRTGATDYFVKQNSETYTEEVYGKLSDKRTLYFVNNTTVLKSGDGGKGGYVLTGANGAWVTDASNKAGAEYFNKDRIFTRTFTNYGQTTMKFSYRHEYYNNRFFESETIELAPGETYVYVYYVPMAWLSTRVANSTTTFELYFGENAIDYEGLLVYSAQAAVLSTAN